MKFVSFDYDPTKVVVTGSEERKELMVRQAIQI